MTFQTHPVVFVLWVAVMVAQAMALVVLIRRNGFREYPAFAAFITFCVARSTVLFVFAHVAHRFYLPVYWLAYAPQMVILVAVVMEVFHVLFHPYDTLPGKTLDYFIHASMTVAAVAVVFTLGHPGAQPTAWMTFARALDQVVTWILCGVFGLIAIFAGYFGIPWRHRVFGIVVGFLGYLCVDVGVATAIAQLRLPPYSPVWSLNMAAFLAACLAWTYYFAIPERSRVLPNVEELKKLSEVVKGMTEAVAGVDKVWLDRATEMPGSARWARSAKI